MTDQLSRAEALAAEWAEMPDVIYADSSHTWLNDSDGGSLFAYDKRRATPEAAPVQGVKDALRRTVAALEMITDQNAIKNTTTINAFAACVEAALIGRKALADQNPIKTFAPAEAQGWRTDMDAMPPLDRVIVAGWQPRSGTIAGYWWTHEDHTDALGVPMEHTNAKMWRKWPAPPAAQEG